MCICSNMKENNMICFIVIFGYIAGCSSAETQVAQKMTLYTDLVDIIGQNDSCTHHTHKNITKVNFKDENLFSKQGIVISNYEFHDVNLAHLSVGKCDVVSIRSQRYVDYQWTCFATDNSAPREPNWFFVDCRSSKIVSVKCLEIKDILVVNENLCQRKLEEQNSTCHEFLYANGTSAVCSKNFRIQKLFRNNTGNPGSYTAIEDIIAYLCIAFILVTFLLAVLIPAEKCKPSYKYDKEQGHRVPLEIYEMYGVSYQPSAKKKRNRKSVNMDMIPAITTHKSNVAAVANNPVNWTGYKTKFKFQHSQPLFQAMTNVLNQNIEGFTNDADRTHKDDDNNAFYDKSSRGSLDSVGSVGAFDYTLFHNPLDQQESDTARKSSVKEAIQDVRKGHNKVISGTNFKVENENFDCTRQEEITQSSVSSKESEHGQSLCQNQAICSNENNEDDDDYAEGNQVNLITEKSKNDNEIIDECDDELDTVDIENYGNDQNILMPILEDDSCTCGTRSKTSFTGSSTSSINSSYDRDVIKVKTISKYQTNDLINIERNPNQKINHTKTVDESKDTARPRISITVEFPKNFGMNNDTKIEHKHKHIEGGNHQRYTKRSLSAVKAPTSCNQPMLSRKYSLC